MRSSPTIVVLVVTLIGLSFQFGGRAEAPPNYTSLSEKEIADEWIELFDGKTMFGWEAFSDANWKIENGVISADQGKPGLLCTTSEFGDFALRVEVKSPKTTNSGIFLRTATSIEPTEVATDCFELNVAPQDNPFPSGSLVQRKKIDQPLDCVEWTEVEAVAQGSKIQVSWGGKQVLEYDDPTKLNRGRIGLQFREGPIAFRKVRIKPLGTKPLLTGKDLSGWKAPAGQPAKFEVESDGALHVVGGKGRLESDKSFGDFVLQLACRTTASNLNSGVFFRCVPGEDMNGYESQIHNGFKDGDRTKPVDSGTGAIFRRTSARIVAANDQEWFYKTIVANGDHFAVWVNGHQVTDWKDVRAPDANPRKGLRKEAGTIMLQAHDPTTDLRFRDIRASELPARRGN